MTNKPAVVRTVARACFGFLVAGVLAGSGIRAKAQNSLQFSFFQDTQTGSPSNTLTYAATVTNTGNSTVYLNTDNPVFNGPGTLDDSLFYSNFSGPLAAGQSISSQNIFTITLNSDAAIGNYLGSFDIDGGSTLTANTLLATQNFEVVVAAGVPESSSLLLLTLGLSTLCCGAMLRSGAFRLCGARIKALPPGQKVCAPE